MKQLPVEFENRMKTLLGDEFEDFKKLIELVRLNYFERAYYCQYEFDRKE